MIRWVGILGLALSAALICFFRSGQDACEIVVRSDRSIVLNGRIVTERSLGKRIQALKRRSAAPQRVVLILDCPEKSELLLRIATVLGQSGVGHFDLATTVDGDGLLPITLLGEGPIESIPLPDHLKDLSKEQTEPWRIRGSPSGLFVRIWIHREQIRMFGKDYASPEELWVHLAENSQYYVMVGLGKEFSFDLFVATLRDFSKRHVSCVVSSCDPN